MTEKTKNLIKRLVMLAIFGVIIACIIMYQVGIYDISFIKRPAPPPAETEEDTTAETADTGNETETSGTDTDTGISQSETETGPSEELLKLLDEIEDAGEKPEIYTDVYSGQKIVRLKVPEVGSEFSLRTQTVKRNAMIQDSVSAIFEVRTVSREEEIKAISLYFGFIVVDNGKTFDIYTPDGTPIASKFSGNFPFKTTKSGVPLVEKDGELFTLTSKGISQDKVKEENVSTLALSFDYPEYYAATNTSLVPYQDWAVIFVPIEEEEDTDGTDTGEDGTEKAEETDPPETLPAAKLEADEPEGTEDSSSAQDTSSDTSVTDESQPGETESEGTSGVEEDSTEETEKKPVFPSASEVNDGDIITVDGKKYSVIKRLAWGFKTAKGNVAVQPEYKAVYDFMPNGYACVVTFDDETVVINSKGRKVVNYIAKPPVRLETTVGLTVLRRYVDTPEKDIGSIGMYYYDKGYIMMQYAYVPRSRPTELYFWEKRLVDNAGNELELPLGYTLQAYSDGLMLVEKQEQYGYYSTEGVWVVPCSLEEARPFLQGTAAVSENGKWGLIGTDGNMILPCVFDYVSDMSRGIVSTYSVTRGWELYCLIK